MKPRRDRSAAARMRRMRARNKAAGLREARHWLPRNAPAVYSDHRLHEIRSLAMHGVIARKLQRDPRLLAIARRNLARWRARTSDPGRYLSEWERLLDRPLPELLAFLTSTSDDATRLRQSSPFAGVLRPAERQRILDAFRA